MVLGQGLLLAELQLPEQLATTLQQAGCRHLTEAADMTQKRLGQLGISPEQARVIFCQVDFCYEGLSHSALICPSLPPACYDLEVAQLVDDETFTLSEEIKPLLEEWGDIYLNDVALLQRSALLEKGWTAHQVDQLSFFLTSVVDAYRFGEFELMDAEETSTFANDYQSFRSDVDADIDHIFNELESSVLDARN